MPLFGPHRAFEIPGTPSFNPQAEDPRLRRRSVYSFPEGGAPQGPPAGGAVRTPQAASPVLDKVLGGEAGMPDLQAIPDRYPLLTKAEHHIAIEPTRGQHRPSTGRTVGAAAIGAMNAYLNPGQGVGAEAMTNIMEAPYRKAHGEWKRQAAMMTASHELNKIRRGYEQQDAEAQRKQTLFELDRQFKGKQIEGMTTPEQDQQQRARAIEEFWPEAPPEIKNQFILGGKFPPAQRQDTSMNEVEWADAQAQREGHRPGTPQYANRVGELRNSLRSPQRPSAGQISIQRQREATNIANVAIRNARKKVGNNPTLIYAEAIQDVLAGVEEEDVDPSIQRAIIQSIRRQLQPPPGGQREREGFSSEFGLRE